MKFLSNMLIAYSDSYSHTARWELVFYSECGHINFLKFWYILMNWLGMISFYSQKCWYLSAAAVGREGLWHVYKLGTEARLQGWIDWEDIFNEWPYPICSNGDWIRVHVWHPFWRKRNASNDILLPWKFWHWSGDYAFCCNLLIFIRIHQELFSAKFRLIYMTNYTCKCHTAVSCCCSTRYISQ